MMMDQCFPLHRALWILVVICAFQTAVLSDCVWYGQCGPNPQKPYMKMNCEYHGEAKPLETTAAKIKYQTLCRDVHAKQGFDTCCSDSQMITLSQQINMAVPLIKGCPSCLHNFLNLWCEMTCSSNMSQFTSVNTTIPYQNKTGITELNYYLSSDFGNKMYNSCKNVIAMGSTPFLDIVCGKGCTLDKWLKAMGNVYGPYTPFAINFQVTNQPIPPSGNRTRTLYPMNTTTVPCNKAPTLDTQACSCNDCPAACVGPNLPPKPEPEEQCLVFHIDCYVFTCSVVFATFLVAFGTYSIFYNIVVQDSIRIEMPGQQQDDEKGGCFGFFHKGPAANRHDFKRQRLEVICEDDLGFCETRGAKVEVFVEKTFKKWGLICASKPYTIIGVVFVACTILIVGNVLFEVTTDPVKLWSSPSSTARSQKEYFDEHFGPFYRTEMVIISRPDNHTMIPFKNNVAFSNLFDKEFLHQVLDLQLQIENLTAQHDKKTVTLEDICFTPLSPDNKNCTIQSVLNFFQNSGQHLDKVSTNPVGYNYMDHLLFCFNNPTSPLDDASNVGLPCLGTYGGPVFPWVAFGGFPGTEYEHSSALVITILVNNHLKDEENGPAKAWEKEYIDFIKQYAADHPEITISFTSERSVEDEIQRQSEGDVTTILISYMIMFAYITVTLGQYGNVNRILIDLKVSLGLSGVIIVLMSVGASLGFYSYIGVPSTLIIVEVVPFLVLAVGVDNIFILVQTYQREPLQDGESVEQLISRVVGKVGPSMLLTSVSESLAFFLGALTTMPAVKVFSLYAAMAVFIDFLLQISIFVSLLTLDAKRQEANRLDLCCCASSKEVSKRNTDGGFLYKFVKSHYSHFLMKEYIRPIVMVIFVGYFLASCAMVPQISVGLDQKLSMPKDSYVLDYFKNISTYLSVGPPVYFVVKEGHNFSNVLGQNSVCSVSGCSQDSLGQQIAYASHGANYTYLAHPVMSWLDDYLGWATSASCCRYHPENHTFCPSMALASEGCLPCELQHMDHGRPVGEEFQKYISWFLKDNPNANCAKGGHASYAAGVNLHKTGNDTNAVGATNFMTYHTVLKTSQDYIEALKNARAVAKNISLTISDNEDSVFPYSIVYVYYEQYLTIVHDSIVNVVICLAAILVITFFVLGLDLYSAVIVVSTIVMILVDLMGLMYMWDITLNAISLVNLIMAIGISVEFSSHLVRAFAISILPTRKERAVDALSHMGSSVLSGITLTKLGGIVVLAFSKSQLFQVFYFRMYLGIVLFGATHGLIFLPVLLSYFGPPVNKARYFYYKQQEQEKLDSDSHKNGGHAPSFTNIKDDGQRVSGMIVH